MERSTMIGTSLVEVTRVETAASASAASACRPDVEAALRIDHVVLHERCCRRRQQVGDLDLHRLVVRVLNQVEELEVEERRPFGEVPPGCRAREDAAFGMTAVAALIPRHRPISDDLHISLDQSRELGGLEPRDAFEMMVVRLIAGSTR
jgi:hypothetical protein